MAADRVSASPPAIIRAARGSYASFQLVARQNRPASFELFIESPLPVDVYRQWFHFVTGSKTYVPDALIPVSLPYRSAIPDPENRIANQSAQAFWVDVWISPETKPGRYPVKASLRGGETAAANLEIDVLRQTVPDEDVVTMDHNSYGSTFLVDQYPKLAARVGESFQTSGEFFKLIHAYHRILYDHRGTFHQLGYGHGGKVAPEFAPALTGTGRNKHIANWDLFDSHYGPLLDGSAFRNSRRGAQPIPFVYLPINPEWPASFLSWGEPGYEAEFVNVVSEMERHFRAKNWTRTRFELFFNHKKRYKAFPWDGDEVRFAKDNTFFRDYARMMAKAVPASTPVKFVFRADASWTLEQQLRELAGVVNFWVCSGGIASWSRDVLRESVQRGDVVWYYGGPPAVTKPSAEITTFALRAWVWGIHGFIHWLTVSAGSDPWFRFDGGGTALVYPGERFGIEGPIPSIRLKLQRNALQDLALATALGVKDEVTQQFNGSSRNDWWAERPALANKPPDEWSNDDIDDALKPSEARLRKADAASWQRVHEYLMDRAR